MDITLIQHYSKTVKGEIVDHVRINYTEGEKELKLHQFGERAKAKPEFYASFEALSGPVTKLCGLPDEVKNGVIVSAVQLNYSEDKSGDENTKYKITAKLKSGHAATALVTQVNHKFLPEGFSDIMNMMKEEAKLYIEGKRANVDIIEDQEEIHEAEGLEQGEMDLTPQDEPEGDSEDVVEETETDNEPITDEEPVEA